MARPLILAVSILLTTAQLALAVVREVPTQYPTITDAVTAAVNGDTVYIHNGNYVQEMIIVQRSITILGESRDSVRITTPRSPYSDNEIAIIAVVPSIIIKNVTFHDVYANPYEPLWGAILLGDSCVVESCNIVSNDASGLIVSGGHNIIEGCLFEDNQGTSLVMSGGNQTISNCVFTGNSGYYGDIHVNGNDNIIINNSFERGIEGNFGLNYSVTGNTIGNLPLFYLESSSGDTVPPGQGQVIINQCNAIYISGQIISGSGFGILVYMSDSCILENNRIEDAEIYGIRAAFSDNCIYEHNIFSNNSISSLYLDHSNNNVIAGNLFQDGVNGVIMSVGSQNNLVYQNNFVNNSTNAYGVDCDQGNRWYLYPPSGGNYWYDYTGQDNNNDGFGDTPYVLPGGNCRDWYPRMTLVPVVHSGDVNLDGLVNLLDVAFLVNYFKCIGEAPALLLSGDVNRDNLLNGLDVTFLVAYLTGRS